MIDISILTYDKSCKMNKKHDGNDFHICILSLEAIPFINYMKTALINIQNPNRELIVYYTKPLMCNYYRGNVHFTQELVYNT